MPVHDDYLHHRWGRYFTEDFRGSHLRPFEELPVGGHREARDRARAGNLGHNARARRGRAAYLNSIIYDFDPRERIRQILRLMLEVEERNEAGFYRAGGPGPHPTEHPYAVVTTEPGSRHTLALGRFLYGVLMLEDGRFLINHYDGMTDE